METINIPGGTLQITLANAFEYIIMGLFYVIVTKTNALTQTDIGTLSILSFLAATFSLLTLLALPFALTKFASEKLGENQKGEVAAIQKTVTKTVLMLSIVGFAIAALSSQLLSRYLWNNPDYALFIILILIYAFIFNMITLCTRTLQALYLFGKMAALTIIFIVSSRTVATLMAFLRIGVAGVLIGYIIGSLMALTAAMKFLLGKMPKTTKNMPLKPLLYFGLPLFFSSLALLVLSWADVVIITSFTGDYSLAGVYYIVINSVGALSILWIPMMTTIFPALSAQHSLKDLKSISNILRTTSRYVVYTIFPICLGLAITAPTALTFFYGAGYTKGAIPLAVLSIASIIIALYSLFTTTLSAIGKTGQIMKINVISALSAILLLVALVPFLEILGAALARLTTQIISLVLAIYGVRKEIRIRIDKEALWKSALASTATVPFLLALELIMRTKLSVIQTLMIEIMTAAAIYVFSLYILKALKSQDFELLRQAFPKPLAKYLNIVEYIMVR
jgi:O-antigen/teichoic acid export membrane protein